MANSVDPDQTAPIGAVCSGSTLFASLLNLSVMLDNYLQQITFSDAFFLGALRVNKVWVCPKCPYENGRERFVVVFRYQFYSVRQSELPQPSLSVL